MKMTEKGKDRIRIALKTVAVLTATASLIAAMFAILYAILLLCVAATECVAVP